VGSQALLDCVLADGVDELVVPEAAVDLCDVGVVEVAGSLDLRSDCLLQAQLLHLPLLDGLEGAEEADLLLSSQVDDAVVALPQLLDYLEILEAALWLVVRLLLVRVQLHLDVLAEEGVFLDALEGESLVLVVDNCLQVIHFELAHQQLTAESLLLV
jgi:hypothetical protein